MGIDHVAKEGVDLGKGWNQRAFNQWFGTDSERFLLTQDSSFPSSHAQSVATIFSFLFLEGKEHLPKSVWLYGSLVTGVLTLLTGFSRAYLAMHFVSDVSYSSCFSVPHSLPVLPRFADI